MEFCNANTSLLSHMKGVKIYFDEKVLDKKLDIPAKGVRSIEKMTASMKFLVIASKLEDDKLERLLKKQMKSEIRLCLSL